MSFQALLIATLAPYVLIAAASVRGMIRHRHRRKVAGAADTAPTGPRFVLGRTPLEMAQVTAHDVIMSTVRDLDGLAARHMTRVVVAANAALAVRADPAALREVLADLVGNAIVRSPCGEVLISARQHGGRVEIGVMDDADTNGSPGCEDASATTRGILALHGGTLEFTRGTRGNTETVIRLLAPPDRPAAPARTASSDAAAKPSQADKQNSPVDRMILSSSSSVVGTV